MQSLQEIIATNLARAKREFDVAVHEGNLVKAFQIQQGITEQERLVSSPDEVEEDAWMNEGGR